MGMDDFLNDDDKQKLQGYANHLDTYDPKEEMRKHFDQMKADQNRAIEIASRSPFAEKTPEEQQFADKQLGPVLQGLIGGGGFMGGVGKVAKSGANAIDQAAPGAFGRIKGMLNKTSSQGGDALDAIAKLPQSVPQGFTQTAARLESSHPAMQQNRQIINDLASRVGDQHPDVATLQAIYNKMLK